MTTGKMLFLHIILLLMPLGASASTADGSLSADGDADLRASLMVVSPGPRLYQSLGHCALRLVSEEHQLDYCFTFEADADGTVADYVRFFAAQATAFLLLLWLTQVSGIFSSAPNLYLLPLAPIPLLLTAHYRLSPRRDRPSVMATTRRAFTVYTLLLVAFVAATPLSSQLDLTHQLVTATLAVRSLSYSTLTHYYIQTT